MKVFYNPEKLFIQHKHLTLTFVQAPTCVIYFHEFAIWMVGVIVCKLLDVTKSGFYHLF